MAPWSSFFSRLVWVFRSLLPLWRWRKALPLLMKLETAVPWMGLISALIMAGFGTLLLSGNYMVVAEWSQRLASGSASLPNVPGGLVLISAVAATLCLAGVLMYYRCAGAPGTFGVRPTFHDSGSDAGL
jgi:hypothetical protein